MSNNTYELNKKETKVTTRLQGLTDVELPLSACARLDGDNRTKYDAMANKEHYEQ